MKMRNKGKIHPFTSSSSSSSSSSTSSSSSYAPNKESLSVLKLLPAAIFTLVSVLSLDDREVLAYMITRSLKSTNPPSFLPPPPPSASQDKKKRPKKQSFDSHGDGAHNSAAFFDCDCFDCYTSFWFRWDSSPNRELIHQAIEAFEEHLNNGEQSKKTTGSTKNKKKDKTGRRKAEKLSADGGGVLPQIPASDDSPENQDNLGGVPSENEEVATAEADNVEAASREEAVKADVTSSSPPPSSAVAHNHKGLARKVLPDVMGIFNSRLWKLWSPNV